MARAVEYAIAKDSRYAMDHVKNAREALDKAAEIDVEYKKTCSDQIRETEELAER